MLNTARTSQPINVHHRRTHRDGLWSLKYHMHSFGQSKTLLLLLPLLSLFRFVSFLVANEEFGNKKKTTKQHRECMPVCCVCVVNNLDLSMAHSPIRSFRWFFFLFSFLFYLKRKKNLACCWLPLTECDVRSANWHFTFDFQYPIGFHSCVADVGISIQDELVFTLPRFHCP